MSLLHVEKKSGPNWVLIGVSVVFFSIASWAIYSVLSKTKINKVTLCPEEGRSKVVALLIDKTGGFSENQKRILTRAVDNEIDNLDVGVRLAIYELDPDTFNGLSEPIFDKCKPRDGSDANVFVENQQMLAKQFNERFLGNVTEITQTAVNAEHASRSPIIEGLNDLATVYALEDTQRISRIVVISDLLQHSDDFSFYRAKPNISDLDTTAFTLPDLFGVDVQVYFLQRSGSEQSLQNAELLSWWETLFVEANTSDYRLMKVR